MLNSLAGHTPARYPGTPTPDTAYLPAKALARAVRERKEKVTLADRTRTSPEVPSLLSRKPPASAGSDPAPHARSLLPERFKAISGQAALARASQFPLAAGWREQQGVAMRKYLRLASRQRSPGMEAEFAELRSRWHAHPADLHRSLMHPYRNLLAYHGLELPGTAAEARPINAPSRGTFRPDAQTLERLLGFFTEEQHAVACLASDLAKTELAQASTHWARSLDEMLACVKAEYVLRVSESPATPSPAPRDSGAGLVARRQVEVAGVRPADHTQSLG